MMQIKMIDPVQVKIMIRVHRHSRVQPQLKRLTPLQGIRHRTQPRIVKTVLHHALIEKTSQMTDRQSQPLRNGRKKRRFSLDRGHGMQRGN